MTPFRLGLPSLLLCPKVSASGWCPYALPLLGGMLGHWPVRSSVTSASAQHRCLGSRGAAGAFQNIPVEQTQVTGISSREL